MREALLDADRERGARHRAAHATIRRGDRRAVRRQRTLRFAMADRVGRRLPRLSHRAWRATSRRELLTRDDTYRHLGEEPPPGGSPDDPARMVGNGAVSAPNVDARRPATDDEMLVLCSDGVHKHVDAARSHGAARSAPLARRCLRLVELARCAAATTTRRCWSCIALRLAAGSRADASGGPVRARAAASLILMWPERIDLVAIRDAAAAILAPQPESAP